jgi:mono/diheme cytochrome c family protein
MKPVLVLLIVVSVALTGVYGIITVYDNNMRLGRMWQTPAIRPHEQPLPIMAAGTVPLAGGEALIRTASDSALVSPIKATTAFNFKQAEKAYTAFCSQCHGKNHDGLGTVGQSFAPLPGDLRSKKVQAMADGTLFKEISYGIPGGRQPALATTVSMADRWQIIAYLKSLGTRP